MLLVVAPFASPNFAYPAPGYLARYLKRRGVTVQQADTNIELLLRLFSRDGLEQLFDQATPKRATLTENGQRMVALRSRYLSTIDLVMGYLRGRDPSIAYRMSQPGFLPRGHNFELNKGFDLYDGGSTMPVHDRARFIGTQYLYDIGDLVREAVFPYFQITLQDRQYDSFVHHCTTFDQMNAELTRAPNMVDQMLLSALDAQLEDFKPDLVGISVPFARNLYWAFRMGQRVKEWRAGCKVAMGGGFFNTSMREQRDARVFDYVDFVTLDDGEKPVWNIVEYLDDRRDAAQLKRTWTREGGELVYRDGDPEGDASHEDAGAPDYTGYRVGDYFAPMETTNIGQRVFSDGWWNKMTMAHGCYWRKCSFCDIHLSYVGDYETASAANLVDKVEEIIKQTGHTGFHFVDEAMPPKIMRDFAAELIRRNLHISWHGMMRFDRAYTKELCQLLAASGLVTIFGGLEVASDRVLALMEKGTSIEQVTRVAKNMQDAGIRVHAYLMYGFPTQTDQETVDALDVVRQLFKHGLVTSASWAKFGVTPHSPVGRDPAKYKIELLPKPEGAFVEQIIQHVDPTGADHERYTEGLQDALRFFSMGFHTDTPVEGWFKFEVPQVSIDRYWIARILWAYAQEGADRQLHDRRVVWLGVKPTLRPAPFEPGKIKMGEVVVHAKLSDEKIVLPMAQARWLCDALDRCRPDAGGAVQLMDLKKWWEASLTGNHAAPFDTLKEGEAWQVLLKHGLVLTPERSREAAPVYNEAELVRDVG